MNYSLPKFASCLLLGTMLAAALSLSPILAAPLHSAKAPSAKRHPLWVTAYYAVWVQQSGKLTPAKIDYSAFSHLIHFAIVPQIDGSIDDSVKAGITPAESQAVLGPAHRAGRTVLLSVGGWNTSPQFRAAYSDPHRAAFVKNLVQRVVTRGYDGLDIDMEPLESTDAAGYEAFIRQLRAEMHTANPRLLLTAAASNQPEIFGAVSSQFDQINLMTYDLSGPWTGFKTWHNAALYGNGSQMMNPGQPFPSAQGMVQRYVQAGVPRTKMGIGAAFYGCVWSGADGPGQSIQGVTVNASVDYDTLMNTYYQPGHYHWDAQAQAPYLSIDGPQKQFVSYDDERLCAEKVAYARAEGLGGVMIWELGSGYRPNQPNGHKDPLLQAVKRAWLSPGKVAAK
ncbi:MAG: glycoside hydrolase family 18 protein [Janthinobacterium lividum]